MGLTVPDTVPVQLPPGLALQLDSFMLGHSEVPWSQVDSSPCGVQQSADRERQP
jgi:hypothetical protein